jgi:hypothetical protein
MDWHILEHMSLGQEFHEPNYSKFVQRREYVKNCHGAEASGMKKGKM